MKKRNKKRSTGPSRVVPHRSTTPARTCLPSLFGWEAVSQADMAALNDNTIFQHFIRIEYNVIDLAKPTYLPPVPSRGSPPAPTYLPPALSCQVGLPTMKKHKTQNMWCLGMSTKWSPTSLHCSKKFAARPRGEGLFIAKGEARKNLRHENEISLKCPT